MLVYLIFDKFRTFIESTHNIKSVFQPFYAKNEVMVAQENTISLPPLAWESNFVIL